MWKEIFRPTLLCVGAAFVIAFIVVIIIETAGLRSAFIKKVTSGIVTDVEVKISDGNFWNSKEVYTIVKFEDGRVILFKSHIDKLYLNKHNEFIENTWNGQVHARLYSKGD